LQTMVSAASALSVLKILHQFEA